MDALIYSLVLNPALQDLLGKRATPGDIGRYGGIILAVFLVGWAFGGILFGIVADRFGRARALVITILVYAIFTGLAGTARSWQELMLYRFCTALGLGGEWAAGATLVAEVLPESFRVKAAGLLQSAWAAGYFVAAGVYFFLSPYGWRVMFFVGIAPALVALAARLKVREPERWQKEVPQRTAALLAELFTPQRRRDTIVGSSLAFVAVFGLWGATNWTPSLITEMLGRSAPTAAVARKVSYAIMSLNVGALIGYLALPPIAERIGRRAAFAIMMIGAAVSLPATFLLSNSYAATLTFIPVLGFFTNGIFSGFPIYLPDAHPGHRGRILFQCRPYPGGFRALPHRCVGGASRHLRASRQFCRGDLRCGTVRAAVRPGNEGPTARMIALTCARGDVRAVRRRSMPVHASMTDIVGRSTGNKIHADAHAIEGISCFGPSHRSLWSEGPWLTRIVVPLQAARAPPSPTG
jgi:MFS family permease